MPTPYNSKEFLDTLKWTQKATEKLLQPNNCIASWTDICGFGSMLEDNNWDLEKLQQANIVKYSLSCTWRTLKYNLFFIF